MEWSPIGSQVTSKKFLQQIKTTFVERGGALVESMTFNRRAVGSTPAHVGTLGKSFTYSCLHVRFGVKLRYSIRAVAGRASEYTQRTLRGAIEMARMNE